ncbi:hypothetical protein [Halomonas sp. 25-S5]|uniref:hypothetical protein n=1 Tax=Halomonas sp. 25-S5 TaxID=2994065 RepID=UPI0024699DD7|nr:hypothetical protein [Halomonas sp. 25-S5]
MYTEQDIPTHVPEFINLFFVGLDQLQNISPHLPLGVTEKHTGEYLPVCFFGEFFDTYEKASFVDPYECHRYFQDQTIKALFQLAQHHNFASTYSEAIATLLRMYREKIEKELKEGRETTVYG